MKIDMLELDYAFKKAVRKNCFPGSDGITPKDIISQEEFINSIAYDLKNDCYIPRQPLVFYLFKSINSPQKIRIEACCLADRIVEFSIRSYLEKYYFDRFNNSYDYRKGKQFKAFVLCIEKMLRTYSYINICDIGSFYKSCRFDKINEQLVNDGVDHTIINLIKKCLFTYNLEENGLPLGHVLSNIMSDIFLIDIENKFIKNDIIFIRYIDCFVFFFKSKTALRDKTIIDKIVADSSIEFNKEKSIQLCSPTIEVVKKYL